MQDGGQCRPEALCFVPSARFICWRYHSSLAQRHALSAGEHWFTGGLAAVLQALLHVQHSLGRNLSREGNSQLQHDDDPSAIAAQLLVQAPYRA